MEPMAHNNKSTAYAATGTAAKWFFSIQAVGNGMSDSQNNRFRLGHNMLLLTCRVAAASSSDYSSKGPLSRS